MSMKRKKYEKLLEPMEAELVAMARWVAATGQRLVVIFEGRDTAGKGGAITRSPAGSIRASAASSRCPSRPTTSATNGISSATSRTSPAAGQIALFDRSWYNRAGVEKVMGFCTDAQVDAFLDAVPQFEKMLVDDGILLFKYWLSCDQAQQEERFAERARRPAEAVEAVADRSGGADQICRLHQGARSDAQGDAHRRTRRGPWSTSTTRGAAG